MATSISTVTSISTSVKALYGDELFAQQLREGGINPSDAQIPSLTPAATTMCDLLDSSTLPPDQKYESFIGLMQTLGKGKNIFDTEATTKVFMNASIRAYCPKHSGLIPS